VKLLSRIFGHGGQKEKGPAGCSRQGLSGSNYTQVNAMKQYATVFDSNQQRWIEEDFESRLLSLISSAPDAVRMEITPDMADVMLAFNESEEWRNRPKSAKTIKKLSRAMKGGRWVYTGETIVFGSNGRLLNGQHRLTACVESGCTFECLVAFGVSDEAFAFFDRGMSRTAGHIFAIEKIPHYNFTSSALRIVYGYLSSSDWSGSKSVSDLDSDELLEFYKLHPGVSDCYQMARSMSDSGLMTPRWAGALYYLCLQKDAALAKDFFTKLTTGIGINDPQSGVYMLLQKLRKQAVKPPEQREGELYLAAYLVQAWNNDRRGKKNGTLRWRGKTSPNQPFPRIK